MIKDSPDAPDRMRLSPRLVFVAGTLVTLVLVGLIYLYVPAPPEASSMTSVSTYGAFENRPPAEADAQTPGDAMSSQGASQGAEPPSSAADRSPPGLYLTYCAQCHGRSGDGDAPLARMMASKPPSLVKGPFRFGRDTAALAQIIRQGVGSMPGFAEEISEPEAVALAGFVLALEHAPAAAPAGAP